MICYRCHGKMVKVIIINLWEREYHAMVCTKCGRIYSKESILRKRR